MSLIDAGEPSTHTTPLELLQQAAVLDCIEQAVEVVDNSHPTFEENQYLPSGSCCKIFRPKKPPEVDKDDSSREQSESGHAFKGNEDGDDDEDGEDDNEDEEDDEVREGGK
ncbi:hypothetical protein HAX54_035890 [Datura stramonium]|uniref:Uncharacterized protein n=1 Tax=Datura stramonium TaxID=4076 RepID=A0ABS8VFZ4_DATST|nr:hypothetical protein [Datura stramonium]